MVTITIPKKEYQGLVNRQKRIEAELDTVKKLIRFEVQEGNIQTAARKKWQRISEDMDAGKGRVFVSQKEMKRWLKEL